MVAPASPLSARPWYLEPWPWILMGLPLAAVVASLGAAWIAFSHVDPMVVDNYYKEGLAINQMLDRDRRAGALGYQAKVRLSDAQTVQVELSGKGALPSALQLVMVHPGDPTKDRSVDLRRISPGLFQGVVTLPDAARWHLQLQDSGRDWRLVGDWEPRSAPSLVLRPLVS